MVGHKWLQTHVAVAIHLLSGQFKVCHIFEIAFKFSLIYNYRIHGYLSYSSKILLPNVTPNEKYKFNWNFTSLTISKYLGGGRQIWEIAKQEKDELTKLLSSTKFMKGSHPNQQQISNSVLWHQVTKKIFWKTYYLLFSISKESENKWEPMILGLFYQYTETEGSEV
jgi:hypothetical protein